MGTEIFSYADLDSPSPAEISMNVELKLSVQTSYDDSVASNVSLLPKRLDCSAGKYNKCQYHGRNCQNRSKQVCHTQNEGEKHHAEFGDFEKTGLRSYACSFA
jgi:hypothetical protein